MDGWFLFAGIEVPAQLHCNTELAERCPQRGFNSLCLVLPFGVRSRWKKTIKFTVGCVLVFSRWIFAPASCASTVCEFGSRNNPFRCLRCWLSTLGRS